MDVALIPGRRLFVDLTLGWARIKKLDQPGDTQRTTTYTALKTMIYWLNSRYSGGQPLDLRRNRILWTREGEYSENRPFTQEQA